MVRIETIASEVVKLLKFGQGLFQLANMTDPNVSIVDVDFGPNRRFSAAESLSEDNGSEVGQNNAHGITLWCATRIDDPFLGESVTNLELSLMSGEKARKGPSNVVRHAELLSQPIK